MEALNFQDDLLSISIDNFKDHYVLVFDLTSMQDAVEKFQYAELVGEPLRLELNFTFPLEHVTEFTVLGERRSSIATDMFGVVRKISKMGIVSIQQLINWIPKLKNRYRCSFSSSYVPTLDNDTFAIIHTQLCNMQREHWLMNANSSQFLYF